MKKSKPKSNSQLNQKQVSDFLISLGLSPDQTTIYNTLVREGPLTTLEIARKTGISRTTVYRILESLKAEIIIEDIVDEHRHLAQAVPPNQLKLLLDNKNLELEQLNQLFPNVQHYLNQQINRRQPDTKVLYYRGVNGIQQMGYNVLRAKKEIVGFSPYKYEATVGKKFALKLYEEMYLEKITMRDIYSDRYLKSIGGVEKLVQPFHPTHSSIFTSRYLPQKTLDINIQTDIYNDVVAFYTIRGRELFGVEIHNPKVAKLQKQIFEILWGIATPEEELVNK